MLKKLSFFSVAVRSHSQAIEDYRKLLGVEVMRPITPSPQYGFKSVYLGNGKDAFIELLEPTDPKSPVARFLERHGEGVYLVGFQVDDLPAAVQHVRAAGGVVTGLPEGREADASTKMVWVHPRSAHGAFIEMNRGE
ncbi:MAG: VOC family protein [Chloroflexi bacterium]|nr:VOC family protein [Chloroflexota bacterium]